MSSFFWTIGLLLCSNTCMAFAWYAHLKHFPDHSLIFVILLSWGIAFLEYIFLIPAHRIGFQEARLTLAQLKILQEAVTLLVFVPFALLYMNQKITLNFLWAGLCLVGAIYFIFKT